jgi:mannose-6-phosphate isomerase
MKLARQDVEKLWGREALPAGFCRPGPGRRVGETWFAAPGGGALPLLVKYIFTAEPLSVQVHPDDRQARARGLPHGKSECWYIVEAEPEAQVAVGLAETMSRDALRRAALDGSIAGRLAWRNVAAGDFFHIPAGTIHAIGAGVSLIEVQQPSDVTYRLYDHGRPRALHVDEAVAVARLDPAPAHLASRAGEGVRTLVSSPHFTLVHVGAGAEPSPFLAARERWLIPLSGSVSSGGDRAGPGECLLASAHDRVEADPGAAYLVATAGAASARREGPSELSAVA